MRLHQCRWGCVWKNSVGNERRAPVSGREDGGQGFEDGDERSLVDGRVGVGVGDEALVLQRAMRPERATTALVGNSAPARTAAASMMLWGTTRAGERPAVMWAGPARGRGSHPWWPWPRQACGGPRQPLWDGAVLVGSAIRAWDGGGWRVRLAVAEGRQQSEGGRGSDGETGAGGREWGGLGLGWRRSGLGGDGSRREGGRKGSGDC